MKGNDWPDWHCPTHKAPLVDEGEALTCPHGERFRKERGIPRFVPETSYADAFGAQWNHYRQTQLDSYTRHPITALRTERCLGDTLWHDLAAKHVLEVGCGAGRFTEVLLQRGARITSVDLSAAVEANLRNFPADVNHRVAQANAVGLPFAEEAFDLVFCVGVVQHTPSPEQTIASLYRAVKPGGYLVFDHYTYALANTTKLTEPLLRRILMRVPPQIGIRCTETLVKWMLPLHRAVRNITPAQYLLSRVSPIRSYYHRYPELSDALQEEWAKLDTHDALTSWYRHKRSARALRKYLESLGAADITCNRAGNGVEVRVRRPLRASLSAD